MRLSVVIPTLNESLRIGSCLDAVSQLRGVSQIVVADGKSSDGTPEIVKRHPTKSQGLTQLIVAPRGRGPQLNAGARAAQGDVLLFLHADVRLPEDAIAWVRWALGRQGTVAGAFRTRTIDDSGKRYAPWLRLADIRSRLTSMPYGDQALFLRQQVFWRVGGYPNIVLMEDTEICRRLTRLGKIRVAPANVRVSGRRFLTHPLRDTILLNTYPTLYRLGVSPQRLRKFYLDTR